MLRSAGMTPKAAEDEEEAEEGEADEESQAAEADEPEPEKVVIDSKDDHRIAMAFAIAESRS